MFYYQFRRRHDYPPYKQNRCLVNPPRILTNCGFVFDRRSIVLLTQNLYEQLQKYDVWSKHLKCVVLLLTAAA